MKKLNSFSKLKMKSKKSNRRLSTKRTLKRMVDNGTYYQLKNYNFKDLDVTKYVDPNAWEKPSKLPEEFQKMVNDAYTKIKSTYAGNRFYGLEGFEVKIKPSGIPSSPLNIISFSTPRKPESYSSGNMGGVFNIIHFAEVPTEIVPNLSIMFMEKKKNKNKFFNKYDFEEVSRVDDIKSGTTLIIPEDTYFKFSNVNSKSGVLNMKVLVFQCYK
jgi:hypothetical protein